MTEVQTLTLREFLLARIAEDEQSAREAASDYDGVVGDGKWIAGGYDEEEINGHGFHIYAEGGHGVRQAEYIARHDPARVLAECESKRRIVEEHCLGADAFGEDYCGACVHHHSGLSGCENEVYPCPTLRFLALPYADHPDYREEWKP